MLFNLYFLQKTKNLHFEKKTKNLTIPTMIIFSIT